MRARQFMGLFGRLAVQPPDDEIIVFQEFKDRLALVFGWYARRVGGGQVLLQDFDENTCVQIDAIGHRAAASEEAGRKTTPAMKAGLADSVWDVAELLVRAA
jgi:hypothetical protein